MTIEQITRDVQKALGLTVDGKAGPQTWGAIWRAVVRQDSDPTPSLSDISVASPRSEKVIASLIPEVRPLARALYHECKAAGFTIEILSGYRSMDEQAALYAKGRTATGHIVTKARPGHSSHNFGIAFDIGVFSGSSYVSESPLYDQAGAIGRRIGLSWGGDWKSFQDTPHFYRVPTWARGMTEAQMLQGLRDGKPKA